MSVTLSSLYTYMFAGLCASLAGVASQAGDADSSRAPGLTSGSWTEPGVLACTLQFTVILKNLAKCLWRREPDRRYNFGPPAHLCHHMCDWNIVACDVKHQVEKRSSVSPACRNRRLCLNNPVGGLLFWLPIDATALGAIFFVCELFFTAPRFVWKLYRERADRYSRLPLDLRFLECPAPLLCFVFIMLVCWHSHDSCFS